MRSSLWPDLHVLSQTLRAKLWPRAEFSPRWLAQILRWLLCGILVGGGLGVGILLLLSDPGLAAQGEFDSIIVDMRQDVGAAQVEAALQQMAEEFRLSPHLNSQFSLPDRVFVVKGDRQMLHQLRRSPLAKFAESIEPNYIYQIQQAADPPIPVSPPNAEEPEEEHLRHEFPPAQAVPAPNLQAPQPTTPEATDTEETTSPRSESERPTANTPARGDQNPLEPSEPASPNSESSPNSAPQAVPAPAIAPPAQPTPPFAIPPNDPDYPSQWNLRQIKIEAAWPTSRGQGVTVAVIDTGVNPLPDLPETRLVEGYDFVRIGQIVRDDQGHGSSVAGTIAQATHNHLGSAGVAPEAKILPLKVLDREGKGTVANIAEAIHLAVDRGAQVITLGLGGTGDSPLLRKALAYAHQQQVVLVAAAGNQHQAAAIFPARYPFVIGVAALDAQGQATAYSNYGAGVDIAAPGGTTGTAAQGIWQNTLNAAKTDAAFSAYWGTSAAAAHVAGVAALLKAQGVELPDQIETILQTSATSEPQDAWNQYGAGRLNAAAAIASPIVQQRWGLQLWPDQIWQADRWLRDRGYLPVQLWLDPQVMAIAPKLIMLGVACGGLWLLHRRWRMPLLRGSASLGLWFGLIWGSCGLFWFKGLYVFDQPQVPLRLLGSAWPELAGAMQGSLSLHPATANALLPLLLAMVGRFVPGVRPLALGLGLGVAAHLGVSNIVSKELLLFPQEEQAQAFLVGNAIACLAIAVLMARALRRRRLRLVRSPAQPLQKV